MQKFILTLFLIGALMLASPVRAQDKIVPDSRPAITMSFAPLVKKVAPAVVSIYTKQVVTQQVSPFMGDPFFQQFFNQQMGGIPRERVESALGSGVIIDEGGLIVTNAHVIHNAQEIRVTLNDGEEFPAETVLVDTPSDLALLRINPGSEKLPTVTLEPSEKMEVGDLVLAIGNPFGVGQTVTSGIISALARTALNVNAYNFFIQTDAAINPGNSGGPLVAMDGGVVGINSAIFSRDGGSLGIGFAIPSEMVATLISAEKSGQKGDHGITRAWLGMDGQTVTHDIAESLGLKIPQGVLVSNFSEGSPAKAAGLKTGDVVTAVNGHPIHDPAELKFRVAMVPLGSPATFTVTRNGAQQTIPVTAAAPPDVPARDETLLTGSNPFSGVRVSNINPAVAVELGIKQDSGVVITGFDKAHPSSGLVAAGDIIVSVNDSDVKSVANLQQILAAARPNYGWKLVFSRNGQTRQIVMR